ncbi:MAG: arsenate reductase ArsC [Candidatus Omnitrophota bacterium]|nr:MAG: arsenate reductase ArsC [Candidatus Omnitrophota bacterium]
MKKIKVLFICTHNSVRSQMAEGLLKSLGKGKFETYSAGTHPAGVNPDAIKVMAEIGIDISNQYSKSIEQLPGIDFDWVVTVCDHAKEVCPFFPGENVIHKSFYDPGTFIGTEEERLTEFRRVRDEIKDWLKNVFIPTYERRRDE